MNRNDILRRIRYALNISNSDMAAIFKLAGHETSEAHILDIMKKEEQTGYVECSTRELELFLDGLIIFRRGKKEDAQKPLVKTDGWLSNNQILKKLRIALNFKEDDMLEMFRLSEFEISKPELSAFFRKEGHKNYRICQDQVLKNFLKGLTVYFRTK